jgi:hypothetical protein
MNELRAPRANLEALMTNARRQPRFVEHHRRKFRIVRGAGASA